MPQGLQAWDANGNLVVDLTDAAVRYMTTVSRSVAMTASSATFTVNGVRRDTHFASVYFGSDGDAGVAVITDNTITVNATGGQFAIGSGSNTLWVEVYVFKEG